MNISHANYPKVSSYVAGWKKLNEICAENPNQMVVITRFEGEIPAWRAKQKFIKALHNRINARGGIDKPRGKKDNMDYYYQEWRDSRKIMDHNRNRVIIRQFETKVCRNRFAHMIDTEYF